jgi:hypothetical protein
VRCTECVAPSSLPATGSATRNIRAIMLRSRIAARPRKNLSRLGRALSIVSKPSDRLFAQLRSLIRITSDRRVLSWLRQFTHAALHALVQINSEIISFGQSVGPLLGFASSAS